MDVHLPARAFVEARRNAVGLPEYPGPLPADLDQAYAIQDAAINLWSRAEGGVEPGGWKAGLIAPQLRTPGGDERLIGPVWPDAVHRLEDDTLLRLPVFGDGFVAVEAEFVVRLDAAVDAGAWTAEQVAGLPLTVFAGVEIASSPLAAINDLGPAVTISDFGNNAGVIIGSELPAGTDLTSVPVRTTLGDEVVGEAAGAARPDVVPTSLAQTLTILGRRGWSVPAGSVFATGALTGVHQAAVGQTATVRFGHLPELRFELVPARPR